MKTKLSGVVCTIGLLGMSAVALAGEHGADVDPNKPIRPQEPIGFVTGAVVGGFAGGPIGAVIGAGLGTWLGNRVHRAAEAGHAEARLATLQADRSELQSEKDSLLMVNQQLSAETGRLTDSNRQLVARIGDLSDGLQGDVLFRTGSAEITPEIAHQVQSLAQAVARTAALRVRVDGFADPRGSDEDNMRLSQERADAVRDLLLAAGVGQDVLEVNAYGKTRSVATDSDGYALERRVRVTLRADAPAAVAQVGENE
jgi:outer membrane protein OmpA-like peptidoglycan-associated protein